MGRGYPKDFRPPPKVSPDGLRFQNSPLERGNLPLAPGISSRGSASKPLPYDPFTDRAYPTPKLQTLAGLGVRSRNPVLQMAMELAVQGISQPNELPFSKANGIDPSALGYSQLCDFTSLGRFGSVFVQTNANITTSCTGLSGGLANQHMLNALPRTLTTYGYPLVNGVPGTVYGQPSAIWTKTITTTTWLNPRAVVATHTALRTATAVEILAQLEPLYMPVAAPRPKPWVLPWRLLARSPIIQNAYSRQTGNVVQTATATGTQTRTQTTTQTSASPGRPVRVVTVPAVRKPPLRNEKERKYIANLHASSLLAKVISGVTESNDFVSAVFEGLPDELQKGRHRPDQKLVILWNNLDKLDNEKAFRALIRNSIEDHFYGGLGKLAARAVKGNPYYKRPVGLQTGKADSVNHGDLLGDVSKFIGDNGLDPTGTVNWLYSK